jgi:hypothetical protein
VQDAGDFAGAHVLSMVRTYYLLIDFKHFTLGYPKGIGLEETEKLRTELIDLSANIVADTTCVGRRHRRLKEQRRLLE